MKKLTLDSNVLEKVSELFQKIAINLYEDNDLSPIDSNIDKLSKYIYENSEGSIGVGEVFNRKIHYIILDNLNLIGKYLDDSKEVEILRTNKLGLFEIIEKTEQSVKFLDISLGEIYEIIGEWELDGKSILNSEIGDLLISRIIKLEDGWYNMKSFYYLIDGYHGDGLEELKKNYKYFFSGIKDVFDMEERMNELNSGSEYEGDSGSKINYLKRIKKLLIKPVGKKKYKELEKILQKKDNNSYSDFFDYLSKIKISDNILNELKNYVNIYLKENVEISKDEKEDSCTCGNCNHAYELKIRLYGLDYTIIERVIWIRPNDTFFDLHSYIQDLFGLNDIHLWTFRKMNLGNKYGLDYEVKIQNDEFDSNNNVFDPFKTEIKDIFKNKGEELDYWYDFGDNWHFDILFQGEEYLLNDLPRVFQAKGGNIIENCGGVYGLSKYLSDYDNNIYNEDIFDDNEEFIDYIKDNYFFVDNYWDNFTFSDVNKRKEVYKKSGLIL